MARVTGLSSTHIDDQPGQVLPLNPPTRRPHHLFQTPGYYFTKQLVEQAETIRENQASLEAALRRESAAVSELARRDAEEARRVEQVRALLAASVSAPASGSCGGNGRVDNTTGAVGPSVAASALSDLAALEEAIAERAREVASLKVCMMTGCYRLGWPRTLFRTYGLRTVQHFVTFAEELLCNVLASRHPARRLLDSMRILFGLCPFLCYPRCGYYMRVAIFTRCCATGTCQPGRTPIMNINIHMYSFLNPDRQRGASRKGSPCGRAVSPRGGGRSPAPGPGARPRGRGKRPAIRP